MTHYRARTPWPTWKTTVVSLGLAVAIICTGGLAVGALGLAEPDPTEWRVRASTPASSAAPSSASPSGTPTAAATSATAVPTRTPATDPGLRTVTAGAYCSPEGAVGRTAKGTRMTCKGPGKPRWRS